MKVKSRRIIVRSALVALFAGLLALTFLTGRGHSILIDNKDSPDGSIPAIDGVLVSVDGREELELYSGDRDMEKVKGQTHTVRIESLEDGTVLETKITVPLMSDMMLLSIPMLLAGKEPYLSVFVPLDQAPPDDEDVGNNNSYTSPDAVIEDAPAAEETVIQ